jgi:hypothetical protein
MEATLAELKKLRQYLNNWFELVEDAERTGDYGDYDTLEQLQEARMSEALLVIAVTSWEADKAFRNS